MTANILLAVESAIILCLFAYRCRLILRRRRAKRTLDSINAYARAQLRAIAWGHVYFDRCDRSSPLRSQAKLKCFAAMDLSDSLNAQLVDDGVLP